MQNHIRSWYIKISVCIAIPWGLPTHAIAQVDFDAVSTGVQNVDLPKTSEIEVVVGSVPDIRAISSSGTPDYPRGCCVFSVADYQGFLASPCYSFVGDLFSKEYPSYLNGQAFCVGKKE